MSALPPIQQVPHNMEAEQELLGALMCNNEVADIVGFLKAEHFFHEAHRAIYAAALNIIAGGQNANPVTLIGVLGNNEAVTAAGGSKYLAGLARAATTVTNAKDYAEEIVDKAARRDLIRLAKAAEAAAYALEEPAETALSMVNSELERIAESTLDDKLQLTTLDDAIIAGFEQARRAVDGQRIGIPTYIADLDAKFSGMAPQQLIILAARPSMGKSALAQAIALNAARNGYPTLFISLEMSAEELGQRALASMSSVAYSRMRAGHLRDRDFDQIGTCMQQQANRGIPLTIEDRGNMTVGQIRRLARRQMRRGQLKLLVIDYLGLIRPEGRYQGRKVDEVGEITVGLKRLAKELGIPVLVLAQLSRGPEAREDKRPNLADLRDSGSIEQDADAVLFVYRDEYYEERKRPAEDDPKFSAWADKMAEVRGVCEVIIAKQRMGGIGTARIYFDAATNRFDDLSKRPDYRQEGMDL